MENILHFENFDAVQLTWENWNDICDFVSKPFFVTGVFLDDKTFKLSDLDYTHTVGLLVQYSNGKRDVIKEGDFIIKNKQGKYSFCSELEFKKMIKFKDIFKILQNI